MASELPDEIDCRQFAAGARAVTGTIAATRLTRIAPPYRLSGGITVQLDFQPHKCAGIAIHGTLSAPLEAQCQRCLEWMSFPVIARVDVVAVTDLETARERADDCIPYAEDKLNLRELVEDELLLSCPMAPLHGECAAGAGVEAQPGAQRRQPFAGLASLLERSE